jgi:zinc protease
MRAILALLLLAPLLPAQPDIRTQTLANGMKVIVQEDHGIPNVAMYFFYKVGSRNEHPGATGVSHFFEHMMFNGAKKYGPREFDRMMEKNGGSNNAYTSEDVTVYTDWFPSSALELMFDMEADRIRDLAFDPKMIESERGVVYSERRSSVDNSNGGMLSELAQATAFEAHPYHWPVVGWPSDIESWTMDDLKSHWSMGYAPNNCVMVVVGDVKFDQIMALSKKFIEPIPRREPPPPVRTKEPEQMGERRVTLSKPAQLPIQIVMYHAPDAKNPDTRVLDVISTILDSGQSSRLYKRLVDSQLALSAGGGMGDSLDPTVFRFSMQPRTGVDPATTEKVLYEELGRLQTEPVPEAELRKAKNQMLASLYRRLKTIEGRANLLGSYEVFQGDYAKAFSEDKEIEAVTAVDIQRVAQKYFTAKNRTVATLIPEKAPERTEAK